MTFTSYVNVISIKDTIPKIFTKKIGNFLMTLHLSVKTFL